MNKTNTILVTSLLAVKGKENLLSRRYYGLIHGDQFDRIAKAASFYADPGNPRSFKSLEWFGSLAPAELFTFEEELKLRIDLLGNVVEAWDYEWLQEII